VEADHCSERYAENRRWSFFATAGYRWLAISRNFLKRPYRAKRLRSDQEECKCRTRLKLSLSGAGLLGG
jgi:hypothetical protein